MKVILHSDQIYPSSLKIDDSIFKLSKKSKIKMAYIASKTSQSSKYYKEKCGYYKNIGINDFLYFDYDKNYSSEKEAEVYSCDVIHLSGGDTRFFLESLINKNAREKLIDFSKQGGVIVGVSAGSILMTKDIQITNLWRNSTTSLTPALGLVDFEFHPHFVDNNDSRNQLKAYSVTSGKTIYACVDGSGIIVDNSEIRFFGNVTRFVDGMIDHPTSL